MVVLQLCSSYIQSLLWKTWQCIFFFESWAPLGVFRHLQFNNIVHLYMYIYTSIYKLHFPRACRHDEFELVILLTSIISALNMNSLSIHANFSIGHRKLLYMIFLILTITFFLCAPFWKCYTIESTAQLLDKWIKQVNEP